VFDQAVDPLGKHTLQVALTRSTTSVRRHHTRHRRVRTKKGAELGGGLELRTQHGLEHGQEQVLLPALVLVSVQREHDRLEQSVDLREGNETAEGGDVTGLGLEEEEEVRVLLDLAFVRMVSILRVCFLKMLFELILL
jgi:hypothetical protein